MSAAGDDGGFGRAGEIIAASVIGTLAAAVWSRLCELAWRSGSATAMRQPWHAFASMPPEDRRRAVAIAVVVALIGHVVLAALEPARTRPTIAFTALAWLAAVAAAIAATRHSSAP